MQTKKLQIITDDEPAIKNEIIIPYLNKVHNELKLWESKFKHYFSIDGKKTEEKKLYAFGVFYAMNFLFQSFGEGNSDRFDAIISNMDHFKLGPSYTLANGKKGAQKKEQKRVNTKEAAKQLFQRKLKDYPPESNEKFNLFWRDLGRYKIKISLKAAKECFNDYLEK